jgi:hypothetical protein
MSQHVFSYYIFPQRLSEMGGGDSQGHNTIRWFYNLGGGIRKQTSILNMGIIYASFNPFKITPYDVNVNLNL